jgi:hypothetical protein
MTPRRIAAVAAATAMAVLAGWLLLVWVPRWFSSQDTAREAADSSPAAVETRRINASLFYVAGDAMRLAGTDREVTYGEGTLEQARRIIEAQLEPAPPPLITAIPQGTTLKTIYLTERGEAFVDLSPEVASAHPGGSLNEILTVYTIVHALTANLPAITRVQILVDGREVDTLAGHVDLRRPLPANPDWVEETVGTKRPLAFNP